METNKKIIIENLINNMCNIDEDLYYNIDFKLIHSISYALIKLNIYYSDIQLYHFIIDKIKNDSKKSWYKHKKNVIKRNQIYKLVDYIIDKKQINNFDKFLKYKIYEYYLI